MSTRDDLADRDRHVRPHSLAEARERDLHVVLPGQHVREAVPAFGFVMVSRVRLVSLLMIVTVAPGTDAPCASLTTPTTLP